MLGEEHTTRKVSIAGGYLKFSSAHFITYSGKCERLHGHNYSVQVEIEGTLNDDKLVFDFTILKRLTREICQRLNHRFLLPTHNPHLQLTETPEAWEIQFQDKHYLIPRADIIELPIDNSTAERLAEYICNQLHTALAEYDTSNLHSIMVGVEEAPTQIAFYHTTISKGARDTVP